jgi:magnesium and cobalt transporter
MEKKNTKIRLKKYLSGLKGKLGSRTEPARGISVPPPDDNGSPGLKLANCMINLSDKIARDIMVPRVDVSLLDSSSEFELILSRFIKTGYSRMPVYDGTVDNITGILYVKDILKFAAGKKKNFSLKKITSKPYFIPETMQLDDLLLDMKNKRLNMAITVDEYGGFGGIVTIEDLFEEIFGDMADSDKDIPPKIEKTGKNSYDVDSRTALTDIKEMLNIDLPSEEFDTFGGLVLDLFGKIPRRNDSVKYRNLSFKIKEIRGTRIRRIGLTISPEESPADGNS